MQYISMLYNNDLTLLFNLQLQSATKVVSENMNNTTKKWEKLDFISSVFTTWKAFWISMSSMQLYFSICTNHIVSLTTVRLWNLKLVTLNGKKSFLAYRNAPILLSRQNFYKYYTRTDILKSNALSVISVIK